ncbi:MAG: deoxyribodipyrimidine photo-lyase [Bacteroidota bacterium]
MIHPQRIHPLNSCKPAEGCVIYWMQRDQRVEDNWALLYAREKALETGRQLQVMFCLVPGFLGATIRQYGFMLRGLQEVERRLEMKGIPFRLLTGLPGQVIPDFLLEVKAGLLVTDFNPLKISMQWKNDLSAAIDIPFTEVDAHNILPCRNVSDKLEYAAFTLRKKVERRLPEFLTGFPVLLPQPGEFINHPAGKTDWDAVFGTLKVDRSVPEADWITPGERAASAGLSDFLANRLNGYATDRNFPEKRGQSDLSPWLHFGHLSAQRVAWEVQQSQAEAVSKMAFLEELIVRRELADNFCLHNPHYGTVEGFQPWARGTLDKHRGDAREFHYSLEEFDQAATHDDLWNAAQREMTATGKMHGFMRMYWAKKILQWTVSPEEAMAVAIYLNDRYHLDGRDPGGYAGIAWSIGGTHDRPWGERAVFGLIRYMNDKGCLRKFDVRKYISLHK